MRKLLSGIIIILIFLAVSCSLSMDKPKPEEHKHSFIIAGDGRLECSACNTVISDEYIAVLDGNEVKSYALLSSDNPDPCLTLSSSCISYDHEGQNIYGRHVAIYTKSSRKLSINAPIDTIEHYGFINDVSIEDFSYGTYIENGTVRGSFLVRGGSIQLNKSITTIDIAAESDVSISAAASVVISSINARDAEYSHRYSLSLSGAGRAWHIETEMSVDAGISVDEIAIRTRETTRINIKDSSAVNSIIVDDPVTGGLIINVESGSSLNAILLASNDYNGWLSFYSSSHIHVYGPGDVIKEATCLEPGIEQSSCIYCGNILEDKPIRALGHDLSHFDGKAPTCTESGYSDYDSCNRCGYTTYEYLPALGHDIVNVPSKASECTEVGWNAYEYCTRCDYTTKGEDIPALGHRFSDSWSSDSLYHWHAAVCGHDEKRDISEHSWNEEDKCSICGANKKGTGEVIISPADYKVTLEFPVEWNGSLIVVPNVSGVLRAHLEPEREDAEFAILIDSIYVYMENRMLELGANEYTKLKKGPHEITVFANADGTTYSESYVVIARDGGAGTPYGM